MKKINLRNPLAIYCLTLASLILTIGVIYVIVDVNSKLAPDNQILFSPNEDKENEDKHFLKVSVWEHFGEKVISFSVESHMKQPNWVAMEQKERYKETFLKKGEVVRIAGAERFKQGDDEYINKYWDGFSEYTTGIFLAYADAELTVKSCFPTPYWGKPCGLDEFMSDKLYYHGDRAEKMRRGSLMVEAFIKDSGDDYIVGQTDERGQQLDYSRSTERLCDVNPKVGGQDAYVTRDVFVATLEFLAYSRTDPEKVIAFAKIRITNYSNWNFKDINLDEYDIDNDGIGDYCERLASVGFGLEDDLENYTYTTAELIDYWESDDLR